MKEVLIVIAAFALGFATFGVIFKKYGQDCMP